MHCEAANAQLVAFAFGETADNERALIETQPPEQTQSGFVTGSMRLRKHPEVPRLRSVYYLGYPQGKRNAVSGISDGSRRRLRSWQHET